MNGEYQRISYYSNIEFKLGPNWAWSVGQSNQMLVAFVEWFVSGCCRIDLNERNFSKEWNEQGKNERRKKCAEIRKWTGLFNEVTRIKRNRWNFDPKPNIKIGKCR